MSDQRFVKILPAPARRHVKRLGRGIGSGVGKTAARGMNGQYARSGGGVRIGFEGGQMPLYRRLPRRGFSNALFKVRYKPLSLSRIAAAFGSDEQVTAAALHEKGMATHTQPVKIVSGQDIDKKLHLDLSALRATKTVITAIEKSGGSVIRPAARSAKTQKTKRSAGSARRQTS